MNSFRPLLLLRKCSAAAEMLEVSSQVSAYAEPGSKLVLVVSGTVADFHIRIEHRSQLQTFLEIIGTLRAAAAVPISLGLDLAASCFREVLVIMVIAVASATNLFRAP